MAGVPIRIYDVMGRLVDTEIRYVHKGESVLRIQTELPQGLYLLKIGNKTERIVIE